MSYLRFGRKADGNPSGIGKTRRGDIMMLGLGGNSEDVEDDGEANQRRPYISSSKLSGDK